MYIKELPEEEIEDIFSSADPAVIPSEYIQMVRLETLNGKKLILTGKEFKKMMTSKEMKMMMGSVEVSLNMNKFSKNMKAITEEAFGALTQKVIE